MILADSFYQELGMAIRARRETAGLKQAELGERLGLSRTSVTNIESGRQRLLADQLCRVAEILDCEVKELIEPALRNRRAAKARSNTDLRTMPTVAKFVAKNLNDRAGRL